MCLRPSGHFNQNYCRVVIGPAPHRVSRALRARNPGRVRKESVERVPGAGPQKCRKSAPRSLKRVRKSGFTLFSDSFETPGRTLSALLGPCTGVLFSNSSGIPGPKGPGDPVWGGADRNCRVRNYYLIISKRALSCNFYGQQFEPEPIL